MKLSEIKKKFLAFHSCEKSSGSKHLDQLLNLKEGKTERHGSLADFSRRFGTEDFSYEATNYRMLRHLFKTLQLKSSDTFYDLGAGFGKVIIYGALTGTAQYRGIEIIRERADAGNRLIRKLGLKRAGLIPGNVLDYSLDDGDVFFIFNSFFLKRNVMYAKNYGKLPGTSLSV